MVENYLEVFRKYAVFSGRASRKEFWLFYLANLIITIFISLVIGLISTKLAKSVSSLYNLVTFLPYVGVAVRRFHDVGESGKWLFAPCIILVLWAYFYANQSASISTVVIPVIFIIAATYYLAKRGELHSNKYGPAPK